MLVECAACGRHADEDEMLETSLYYVCRDSLECEARFREWNQPPDED